MKVITANRLTDGRVIYRTADAQWSPSLAEAQPLENDEADNALAIAEGEFGIAVGPYLIDYTEGEPGGQKWRREGIRLAGPTAGTTRALGAA